jgi:hypothetical protein
MTDQPSTEDQMSLAMKAMASHVARSERVDRTGWTDDQWIADAQRLMDDIDGSVMSLVNGHVLALLRRVDQPSTPAPSGGLHPCRGCGVELDGDDARDLCEDCTPAPSSGGTLTDDEREALEVATALYGWATHSEALEAVCKQVERILAARAAQPPTPTAVEALRDAADEVDSGPTFPLPPSVVSALLRERADSLAALAQDKGEA